MCSKFAAFLGKLVMGIALVCISTVVRAQVKGDGTCTISGTYRVEDLFAEVRKQTGVNINFEISVLDPDLKVKVDFKKATPEEVVEKITNDLRLDWIYMKGQIVIKEGSPQPVIEKKKEEETISITGFVTDTLGNPLPGSTVLVKGTMRGTTTGENGRYVLDKIPPRSTLVVLSIGYLSRQYRLDNEKKINFHMEPNVAQIAAVEVTSVATGYQVLPKNRTTGSFVLIDSALLNRNPSPNILERLEGVTSGLLTLRAQLMNMYYVQKMPTINFAGMSLRGISTLSPNQVNVNPLLILDNFPYEGDIRNINPNDIESISVLKDAAAASIWGARSGNGVIVLTSKRGKYNQKMKVDLNMNFTVGAKPNLFYDPNYMEASDYIEVEKTLFDRGYFNNDLTNRSNRPAVTPAVEIFSKLRGNEISIHEAEAMLNELRKNDLRSELSKYSYQRMVSQQYSVGVRGGNKDFAYYLSLGHDRNKDNLINNGRRRTTVISSNSFKPVKRMEVKTYLNFSQSKTMMGNEVRYGGLSVGTSKYSNLYPYARLADENGHATDVVKDYRSTYKDSTGKLGFLDWQYRPLDEMNNRIESVSIQNLVLRTALKYTFSKYVNAQMHYQNERQIVYSKIFWDESAYYSRNLINKFAAFNRTTNEFTYNLPRGGIMEIGDFDWRTNSVRGDINFERRFEDHFVRGILGLEIRELSANGSIRRTVGHLDENSSQSSIVNSNTLYQLNPNGNATIESLVGLSGGNPGVTNRFISYYTNIEYGFKSKYDLSLSARRDGANLLGIEVKDKIAPFWSTGIGWDIHKEEFITAPWVKNLRLRASFGENGNIYNGTAYLVGRQITDPLTGADVYQINDPANNRLKWERIQIVNLGLDFSYNTRLDATIEYYIKRGVDLIQRVPLAPQTGFGFANLNSANTRTKGFDITVSSRLVEKPFIWNTTLLLSTLNDEITRIDIPSNTASSIMIKDAAFSLLNIKGKPLRGILSYKWAGIDPQNGDPMGYINGIASKDYNAILRTNPDSLVFHGSGVPTVFGSFRNDFEFKGFSVSWNLIFKLGYYFRRTSVNLNYIGVLNQGMHVDYSKRWRESGDELTTNVPSLTYPFNDSRNLFYQFSEVLVERGDHIRLQDIRIAYHISKATKARLPVDFVELYASLNNVGIIWCANKHKLDPDLSNQMSSQSIPVPFSITSGLVVKF
ncbi:SusC/RagA family TonB-linked outer membrane protein [Chitinophaga barathri]|uniref:SusC/RagA family TonB-linked outer membrane protein n=2 Tax=Chitinophaga barathri TaxID=1647451 RepID=A0A3N4MF33_9BACT|nr:SusC/RagA family TonB-linked outer membrane protein [Chitinophaga barathri]